MLAKLFALFVSVALAELAIFIVVGSRIGLPATFAIILLSGILGATLTRTQGARAWHNFRAATTAGRLPHAELIDGLLILIAGVFLITPGFLTDSLGLLVLIPPVRARLRQFLTQRLAARFIPAATRTEARHPNINPHPADGGGTIIDV